MADAGTRYIGLISGTSVDGVDAALVDFPCEGRVDLIATRSHPMPRAIVEAAHALIADPTRPAIDAWRLDSALADVFAEAVAGLLDDTGMGPADIAAIGSHGQTVWHEPDAATAFTVQLGDPSRLAELTGIRVVADFRRRDMAAGGQGAPLAPALHAALFRREGEARGVLNLGGIANLTCLPASGDRVLGFDTGPANTLMDAWARRHLGQPMDRDGAFAAAGRIDDRLLARLLDDPYYARTPPKSTGREAFNEESLARAGGARLDSLAPADVMRTLLELTVRSVADAVQHFAADIETLYLCGGGASNPLLVDRLRHALVPRQVASTDTLGLSPDWVEAVCFAWLAKRRMENLPGNLPSVTGASRPVVLGGVY